MKSLEKIKLTCYLLVCILIFSNCNPQKKISGNYSFETECMGVEMDGSQTVKAWGTGKNRADAVEQAKKNAVNDVLFKGIRHGKQECQVIPLVNEVNARMKNEDYFNRFFTDGGEYKNFVSMKDESFAPKIFKDRKAAGSEVEYGVILRILRPQLKQKMITDNILKQQ